MEEYDVIVIGAGISGLTLANSVQKKGLKTLVLEKSDKIGGAFHTFYENQNDPNGFWIELGAHSLYNSYSNLISILQTGDVINSHIQWVKHPFMVYKNYRVQSLFNQLHFLELLWNIPKGVYLKKEGRTIKEYYSAILGEKNFTQIMKHFFNAVPSQNSENFPAELLFKKRNRQKDFPRKFSPIQGLGSISDSIRKNRSIPIQTESTLLKAFYKKSLWTIKTTLHKTYHCRFLAIATPSSEAASLIAPLYPTIASQLAKIGIASTESVGVIVRRNNCLCKSVSGIIPLDDETFYSLVSRDPINHPEYRGFTVHFQPMKLDINEKIHKICDIVSMTRKNIVHVIEKNNRMPVLKTGHSSLVHAIDRLTKDIPLYITGNYFYGMSIEDCIIRSIHESDRMLKTLK